jgi:putative phosphoesterase
VSVLPSGLAIISDVHGNLVALEAVVADAARDEIADIVCLGDLAAGGPQPREVLQRLRELGCRAVRGNADGWLLTGLPPGSSSATQRLAEVTRWAQEQLAQEDLDYLAALPTTLETSIGPASIFCFHGSPRSDVEALLATTSEGELRAAVDSAPDVQLLAGGHTHLQLLRVYRDRVLLNPGSVGLPLGSIQPASAGRVPLPTRAEYVLLRAGDDGMEVSFRRVPIDVGALAAATAAMPQARWAEDLARRITRWNERAAGA